MIVQNIWLIKCGWHVHFVKCVKVGSMEGGGMVIQAMAHTGWNPNVYCQHETCQTNVSFDTHKNLMRNQAKAFFPCPSPPLSFFLLLYRSLSLSFLLLSSSPLPLSLSTLLYLCSSSFSLSIPSLSISPLIPLFSRVFEGDLWQNRQQTDVFFCLCSLSSSTEQRHSGVSLALPSVCLFRGITTRLSRGTDLVSLSEMWT